MIKRFWCSLYGHRRGKLIMQAKPGRIWRGTYLCDRCNRPFEIEAREPGW